MHIHKRIDGVVYNTKTAAKISERGGKTLWITRSTDRPFFTSQGKIIPIDSDQALDWFRQDFPHDTPHVAKERLTMKSAEGGKHAEPWMDSIGLARIPDGRSVERYFALLMSKQIPRETLRHSPVACGGHMYFATNVLAERSLFYQTIYDTSLSLKIFEFNGETLWRINEDSMHCTFLVSGDTITPLHLDEAIEWVQKHFDCGKGSATTRIWLGWQNNAPDWVYNKLLVQMINGRGSPNIWFYRGSARTYDLTEIENLIKNKYFIKSEIHRGVGDDQYDYFTTNDEDDIFSFKMKFDAVE